MSIMLNKLQVHEISSDLWTSKPDPASCTLVRLDNANYSTVQKLNESYGIIGTTLKPCIL